MRQSFVRVLVVVIAVVGGLVLAIPSQAQEIVFTPPAQHEACSSVSLQNLTPSVDCVVAMRTQPEPLVNAVPRDGFTMNNYSFWHVNPSTALNLFEAPGGAVVGQIGVGFNFVNAVNTDVSGWVQIEGGQWVREDDVSYFAPSEFRGVEVYDNLERPFAWVLNTLLTSEYPGGPQSREGGQLFLRYDRVNLFSETEVDGWTWYMVGPNQWIDQRNLALAQRVDRPEGVSGRWVAVDLYEQTLVAYEDDTPVFATLVASGLPGFDTNEGVYEVWARPAVDGMSGATGAPDAYALQSVPWVMYFDNDISLHGTYWHDGFGTRRSHGCVNLSISDARHLFEWTAGATPGETGELQTFVYVYSTGIYGTNNR